MGWKLAAVILLSLLNTLGRAGGFLLGTAAILGRIVLRRGGHLCVLGCRAASPGSTQSRWPGAAPGWDTGQEREALEDLPPFPS